MNAGRAWLVCRTAARPALHFSPMRYFAALALLLFTIAAHAQAPKAIEADFVIKDFHFRSGEVLPETRIHYATIGTLRKTAHGTNAVLVLHGTGGSLQQFLNDRFAGVLFAPGGVLDASRFFIVIPDNIGHGKSSKPSDGSSCSTASSWTDWASTTCTWSWGRRWAGCIRGCGASAGPTPRTRWCRWPAPRRRSRVATASGGR